VCSDTAIRPASSRVSAPVARWRSSSVSRRVSPQARPTGGPAAGVTGQRIWQPAGDRHHIVLDLDFDTADQATSFLRFLQTEVWAAPGGAGGAGNAPALAGAPRITILDPVPGQDAR